MPDYSNSLTNHTTENYLKHANFVFSAKHSSPILDLLSPQPGQSIVDLGAGTGQLTEKIKLAVGESGIVVGIDSSEDMVSSSGQELLLRLLRVAQTRLRQCGEARHQVPQGRHSRPLHARSISRGQV